MTQIKFSQLEVTVEYNISVTVSLENIGDYVCYLEDFAPFSEMVGFRQISFRAGIKKEIPAKVNSIHCVRKLNSYFSLIIVYFCKWLNCPHIGNRLQEHKKQKTTAASPSLCAR